MATQSQVSKDGVAQLGKVNAERLRSKSLWQKALWRIRHDPLTLAAMAVIFIFGLLALGAPFITEHILNVDYNNVDLGNTHLPPLSEATDDKGVDRFYILGTDTLGRDHLSRLLYGGQVSLSIGFMAAFGSITIGIVLGVVSGYYSGIFDDLIMWAITTLNSIPQLFLLLIISAVLAPNAQSLILVLIALGWTGTTRIVRGETLSLREREFVLAAQAVGASSPRIMFQHIVPNVISILLIVLSRSIGGLILTESGLSFLGFGVKPPQPTWGNMLTGGLDMLRTAPHLVYMPGLLITVTVLCLYVIGDGLRDAFDPRLSD